jgi:hypothetical protein
LLADPSHPPKPTHPYLLAGEAHRRTNSRRASCAASAIIANEAVAITIAIADSTTFQACITGATRWQRSLSYPAFRIRTASHSSKGPSKSTSRVPSNAHTRVATDRRNARS